MNISLLVVLLLLVNLPLVQAVQISNVRAEEISQNSAVIAWQTDEPANSFLNYGTDVSTLQRLGDAALLQEHGFPLRELSEQTKYYYSVESSGAIDDNGGNFYSFETLPPDIEAPELLVELPEMVRGDKVNFNGTTEAGATVKVLVNGFLAGTTTASTEVGREGKFAFTQIQLTPNSLNVVKIESADAAGNSAEFNGAVLSDTQAPRITLAKIPELVTERLVWINATLSENATLEIFVNNRSLAKHKGSELSREVSLQEGENHIRVVASDTAGWEVAEERKISTDTVPPRITFELLGGTEYYEGRAETDISGETKPGATVYLYVFHLMVDEYRPNFGNALEKVTADAQGKFTFTGVDFPPSLIPSLEQLAPKQVPTGLEEILLPAQAELQRKVYRVYLIAEDAVGKTAYAERTVNVNSCTSGDFAFDVQILPEFQTPYRLNPSLMEQGMQDISAVFNISYRGNAFGAVNPNTGQVESGYKIQQVQFQKACTQKTAETDEYGLGCKLLPSVGLKPQGNVDKTVFYLTTKLQRAAEYRERNQDLWNEFLSRQLKFPLKILLQYQEKEANGNWGQTKTQVVCYDLAYSIDIPVKSDEFLPDELADGLVSGLNETINVITAVEPYLQTTMQIAGVACAGSFLTKLGMKFYRAFQSGFEFLTSELVPGSDKEKKCPSPADQQGMYLESTVKAWADSSHSKKSSFPQPPEEKILDKRCPQTANAWAAEAFMDQFYRWTCDRFLCRAVPAGWTASKEEQAVLQVEQEQTQCAASGNCIPLRKIERCEEFLKQNVVNPSFLEQQVLKKIEPSFPCYVDVDGMYYVSTGESEKRNNMWNLEPLNGIRGAGERGKPKLLAYKPEEAEEMCVGINSPCSTFCQRKKGFIAATDGYGATDGSLGKDGKPKTACYKEKTDPSGGVILEGLKEGKTTAVEGGKFQAGYTEDCFVDQKTNERYQCVCEPDTEVKRDPSRPGSRTALAADEKSGNAEDWDYHQDRTFAESGGTAGTYYPKWRYYSGRDFSSAFGLDAGLDNLGLSEKKTSTKVYPSDYIGSFQTLCLTRINANLQLLKSTLIGLQKCIVDAEANGLYDAGTCKNLFSQAVCGLIYKGIAYLASSCSPLSIKDVSAELSDSDVAAFFSAGFNAIPTAMQNSIDEVNGDYGNAKLKEFFATGAQGFAESICLAAFGFDLPQFSNLLQDVAYSVSTKTTAMFVLPHRELVTFDPIKGKAVHSYELAGVFWPGCKIRGYTTELKCIGIEDIDKPGVDRTCGGQGCDCYKATEVRPEVSGERVHRVASGTKFGPVQKGSMIDLPIQSPERVTSNFRYDHVVFTVMLDQYEDPEQCFDEGYHVGNTGVFYFPIKDVSPPGVFGCSVHPTSGRFTCPQLTSLFGGGQHYFEYPYIQCLDKETGQFVDCKTPNLYIQNEPNKNEIIIKPYLNLGDSKACLRMSDSRNLLSLQIVDLPVGLPGPYSRQIPLGSVNERMIQGTGEGTIIRVNEQSDPNCGGYNQGVEVLTRPASSSVGGALRFSFAPSSGTGGETLYTVTVPNGVGVELGAAGGEQYLPTGTTLQLGSRTQLTEPEVNRAIFSYNGFRFTKVLGGATTAERDPSRLTCTYQVISGSYGGYSPTYGSSSSSSYQRAGGIALKLELLQPGPGDSCSNADVLFPVSNFGRPVAETIIRVQADRIEEEAARGMHDDFINGNYAAAEQKALGIVNLNQNTLDHAKAMYYLIASQVMQNKLGELPTWLGLFFNNPSFTEGKYADDASGEYKKIEAYLCQVRNQSASTVVDKGKCAAYGVK